MIYGVTYYQRYRPTDSLIPRLQATRDIMISRWNLLVNFRKTDHTDRFQPSGTAWRSRRRRRRKTTWSKGGCQVGPTTAAREDDFREEDHPQDRLDRQGPGVLEDQEDRVDQVTREDQQLKETLQETLGGERLTLTRRTLEHMHTPSWIT